MKNIAGSDTPSGSSWRDRALRYISEGRCPFPLLGVPAPGEVGLDCKATCRCGKRVAVTARGLLAHHKPARTITHSEIKSNPHAWEKRFWQEQGPQ